MAVPSGSGTTGTQKNKKQPISQNPDSPQSSEESDPGGTDVNSDDGDTEPAPPSNKQKRPSLPTGNVSGQTADELRAQARKEVRFHVEDLTYLPGEGSRHSTLRRRSADLSRNSIPTTLASPSGTYDQNGNIGGDAFDSLSDVAEEDEPVAEDGDNAPVTVIKVHGEDVCIRGTFADFCQAVEPDIDQLLLNLGPEDLEKDLHEKVRNVASRCGTRLGGPTLPFVPMTEEGKAALAAYQGKVSYGQFVDMANTNPHELFLEMKIRAILLAARQQQVEQLHGATERLDTCLAHALGWVHHLGHQTKPSKPLDPVQFGAANLTQLKSEIARLQSNLAAKDALIAEKDQQLTDLRIQNRQSSVRTDHTCRTNGTTQSVGGRSPKQDGPPIWKGDGTDTITFEYWFRQLKNKLDVNADHFATDTAAKIYIESRVGGDAAANLEPYLEEGHPDQILTTDQLKKHLWNEYRNPSKKEDALSEFSKLKFEPGDDFNKFKNKFVKLAGECRKPKADWKEEFNRKLSTYLKTSMAASYREDAVGFEQFALIASDIADTFRRARQEKTGKPDAVVPTRLSQTTRQPGKPFGGRPKPSGGSPLALKTTPGNLSRPTPDELQKLMTEGRCYICRELGHISRECPKARKPTLAAVGDLTAAEETRIAEEKLLEAQAEMDLYFPDGKDTEDSDQEN